MAGRTVGSREEWLAAREELLKQAKARPRLGDESRRCVGLPWVPVGKDYRFETDGGGALADLFDGRSQLLVYHSCWARTTRLVARSTRRSRTRSTASSRTCTRATRR